MDHDRRDDGRDAAGRWKLGRTGNPKGRPVGSGASGVLRAAIVRHAPQIIEQMARRALAGDAVAGRALLALAVPPLRATDEPLSVHLEGETLAAKAMSVLTALASGKVTTQQASELVGALAAMAQLRQVDELEARISTLEAQQRAGGPRP